MANPSHHLAAEVDTFTADDTPAVRQPAPPRPQRQPVDVPRQPSRPTVESRRNVPRGWSLVRLQTKQKTDLNRIKTRIGKSAECEARMLGTCVDERQCYIEYADGHWQLHQESRSQPTFIDGESQFHVKLKHGSRITFADGSGFTLINADQQLRSAKTRRKIMIALAVLAVAGLSAALWFYLSR
jgi:hypothetical protein